MSVFKKLHQLKPFQTLLFMITTFCCGQSAMAAGLLKSINQSHQDLQIQSHHVEVMIADGYATTQVEQVFANPNNQDLEAIYSFPVPSKAAVGEFSYWIDGVPVTGEILEKKAARQLYNEQKSAGNATAIVEQDNHKTFDISVYPVRANDTVKVRLVYIQPTHTDTGMGRYVYPLEDGGVDEQKMNFWTRNEVVENDFTFNLTFRSAYPVDGIRLPNNPNAVINAISNQEYEVSIGNQPAEEGQNSAPKAFNLNQDIIAYWRHSEGLPGSLDMVNYKASPDEKGTFFMTLTPAMDLQPIQAGKDWVFVLDISGSMQGKYTTLVEGVRKAMGNLTPQDRFKIILFNSSATELTNGYVPVEANSVNEALIKLEQINPNDGTNLYAGIKKAIRKLDSDRPTGIILVTDGVANVGTTEKKRFLDLMEKNDVRLFGFIMGNSANRPLLEGMTKVSHGFYQEVSNADDILGQIMLATSKLTHQSFRDIEVKIEGITVKDMTPAKIKTLYRGEQLHLFGHYWKGGDAKITISGKIGADNKHYQSTIHFPETATQYPEIERLWAFAAIEDLQSQQSYFGENPDTKQAIVDIAKQYSLVTDYTSMVVVLDQVFNDKGIDRNNKKRVENERAQRETRKTQGVQEHRADTSQPLYSAPRPSISGSPSGGAFSVWILLLLPLLMIQRLKTTTR